MKGGGIADKMYINKTYRLYERPFYQMYKLAILHNRFDILSDLEQIENNQQNRFGIKPFTARI